MEQTQTSWTGGQHRYPVQVLVYAGGDAASLLAHPDSLLAAQLRELRGHSGYPALSAVAQIESVGGPSLRWVLDSRRPSAPEPFGETVSGDPNELAEFVRWAAQSFPAERRVLILSGLGLAWREGRIHEGLRAAGLLPSEARLENGLRNHAADLFGRRARLDHRESRAFFIDQNAVLYPEACVPNGDLAAALERAAAMLDSKFDVVAFETAMSCTLETATELVDSARTLVASIDASSAAPLPLAKASERLASQDGLSPSEMATAFVDSYVPLVGTDSCVAFDLEGPAFARALDAFVTFAFNLHKWIRTGSGRNGLLLEALRDAAKRSATHRATLADLGAVVERVFAIDGAPANVKSSARAIVEGLRDARIATRSGPELRESLGISLYIPGSRQEYRYNRSDIVRTRLSTITRWDRVLDSLFLESDIAKDVA